MKKSRVEYFTSRVNIKSIFNEIRQYVIYVLLYSTKRPKNQ